MRQQTIIPDPPFHERIRYYRKERGLTQRQLADLLETARHIVRLGFRVKINRRLLRYRIDCDYCSPSLINGVPCHEYNCPSARHECAGCNAIIPANRKYCHNCQ